MRRTRRLKACRRENSQVVDEVMILVRVLEEAHHVVDVIAVEAFDLVGGKAHGNDAVGNVCREPR